MSRKVLKEAERGFDEAMRQATAERIRQNKNARQRARYEAGKLRTASTSTLAYVATMPTGARRGRRLRDWAPAFTLYEGLVDQLHIVPGNTIRVDLMNGGVIHSFNFKLGETDALNDILWMHFNNSSGALPPMIPILRESTTLRISAYNPVVARKQLQNFREGDVHCLFDAIRTYFVGMVEKSTGKTASNYASKLKKTVKFIEAYDAGAPELELESIGKALDVTIHINNVSDDTIITANPGARKAFTFVNSRINHVEQVTVDMNAEPEQITLEEGREIIQKCISDGIWNLYTGSITDPKTIRLADKRYRIGSDTSDILFDFIGSFDRGIAINSIAEHELCEYLKSSIHFTINFKNPYAKCEKLYEIDMKKAYTQFKSYDGYIGFPGIITNVRNVPFNFDVIKHPGIYTFTLGEFVALGRGIEHLRAWGFQSNGIYTLPSPWIVFLRKFVSVKLLYGAYGKRMDFDFSPEMIEHKLYAPWTGMQSHLDDDLHYYMACNKETAEIVASQHPNDNVEYDDESTTLKISKKKPYHFISPHLSSFVIAYTQLAVLAEAMRYPITKVYAVKLDSIVLGCDVLPYSSVWQDGDFTGEEIPINKSSVGYIVRQTDFVLENKGDIVPYELDSQGNVFHAGPGGDGKTHRVLTDKGFRYHVTKKGPRYGIVYCTVAWSLIAPKIKEYGVQGTSVLKLKGGKFGKEKVAPWKEEHGQPAVIALDEMSMISAEEIALIKEMYPLSQIIMMGDYYGGKYFQSSIIMPGRSLYHPSTYYLTENDYRSADEKTRAFKREVRELMKRGEPIIPYLCSTLTSVRDAELESIYNRDYILTFTHEAIDYFTKKLTGDCWHLVTKHTIKDVIDRCSGKEAYLHGELLTFPINGRTEAVQAHTVHGFQGKTIDKEKCFVDITSFICNEDIYTAISRVRSMDQLYLIREGDEECTFNDGMYRWMS